MAKVSSVSIYVPGANSISYILPHSRCRVHLTAGITNVFSDTIAEAIFEHPMTELYVDMGVLEIKDVQYDKAVDDGIFEVQDGTQADRMPVGDVTEPKVGQKKVKTQYRGKAGKSKDAATEIVRAHKKGDS